MRVGLAKYVLASVAVAAATLTTLALQPMIAPSATPLFILAVAIAALYGGRAGGAAATGLSVAALSYWFVRPVHLDGSADVARLLLFLVVATAITWIAGSVHEARSRAQQQAADNAHLRGQAEGAALEAERAVQVASASLVRQEEAEAALRTSEGHLSDFFDTASTGLHWAAADGTIVRVNQAELDMLGYDHDEYVGHPIQDFHVDRPVIDDLLRRLLAGETIRHCPARLRRKTGEIRHVVIDSSGYFSDGRFLHSRCFTRDVSVERQAQEAMAHLGAIVASSSDGIISKTLDGVVTSWNAGAEHIFGYSAAEIIGESIYKLIPPEHHDQEREVLERLRQGYPVRFSEAERLRKDGTRIWISLSVSPVRDASGLITGAASIKRDITEWKVLGQRLQDAQRLQAVGQLAGGIAHEANNQMSVVLGGAHFLLRRSDLPQPVRSDIEQIRLAAERTASITQQLLAFSRRQMLVMRNIDLSAVVEDISPILRRSLAEDQELVLRLDGVEGTIRADPVQLDQVLLNLTLNARDAMPSGGRLTIETQALEVFSAGAEQLDLAPGRYERLLVSDTGHGMARAVLDHVFEPFFTTKDVGKGSGLGLSVVHGIVSQLGGHIRVDSSLGRGTTFALYFPLKRSECVTDWVDAGEPHTAAPGAVALVAEDDSLVRGMTGRALAEAGYTVLEAANGRDALDLVKRLSGRLDLVITDVGMPVMGGYELARRLQQQRPGLPIVFMTGYGDEASRDPLTASLGPLMQKPFDPVALLRVVGEQVHQQM
jgi:PAS domain S-box-containing protein